MVLGQPSHPLRAANAIYECPEISMLDHRVASCTETTASRELGVPVQLSLRRIIPIGRSAALSRWHIALQAIVSRSSSPGFVHL
jgi:hypothetical protein